MPIKFKCPHCQKPLGVKDELAGKRAACPACKKVLTIPAPTAAAVDIEALAASALADEPAPQPAKATAETIDFNCPFCDEPLHLSADMGGKQAPCPECRRIVKVPMPARKEANDWRQVENRGPSGARRDAEPELEGAWGSASKSTVSADVLEEAGALPEVREPLTLGQKIRRGVLAGGVVVALVVGWLLLQKQRTTNLKNKALDQALTYVEEKKGKLTPEWAAEVHRAAGEYYLQDGDLTRAQKHLTQALARLRTSGRLTAEGNAVLLDLALTQVDLGGSGGEVEDRRRLSWDVAAKHWRRTLDQVKDLPTRVVAVREVCRKLIDRGQWNLAADLMLSLSGLESQADPGKEEGRKPRSLGAPSVALLVALYRPEQAKRIVPQPQAKGQADPVTSLIHSAWLKDPRAKAARQRFVEAKQVSVVDRLQCLLSVAEFAFDRNQTDEARAGVTDAVNLIKNERGSLPPALLLQWAMLAVQTGQAADAKFLGESITDPALRGRYLLEKYRAELKNGDEPSEDGWQKAVPEKTVLAHALALEAFAREQSRRDRGTAAEVLSKVEELEPETLRPFGLVGIALGVEEGNR
jgi:hypothetical protein